MQSVQSVHAAQSQGIEAAQGMQAAQSHGMQAGQKLQDLHDIIPPVPVGIDPFIFKVAFAILAIVCCAIAGYLLFRYLKKRLNKNRESNLPLLPPPLPADQAALRELGAISDLMLIEPRLYYFRLTALLKIFICKIFRINAPEMTTQEIIAALNMIEIKREMISSAREFFISSSMIKYAAVTPEMEKARSDEEFVRSFIECVMNRISTDRNLTENTLPENTSMDNSIIKSMNKISKRSV